MTLYEIIDDPLGEVDRLITDDLIRKVDGPVYRIDYANAEAGHWNIEYLLKQGVLIEVGEGSTP